MTDREKDIGERLAEIAKRLTGLDLEVWFAYGAGMANKGERMTTQAQT